jgi:hypothetical protein
MRMLAFKIDVHVPRYEECADHIAVKVDEADRRPILQNLSNGDRVALRAVQTRTDKPTCGNLSGDAEKMRTVLAYFWVIFAISGMC